MNMISPLGIPITIGQKWQDMDPRCSGRTVEVTSMRRAQKQVQLNGRTWAKLPRFNGKSSGYGPMEVVV